MGGFTNVELTTIIISSIAIIVSIIVAVMVYKQTNYINLKSDIYDLLKMGIDSVNSKIDKRNSYDKRPNIISTYISWIMNDINKFNHLKTIKIGNNYQPIMFQQLEEVYICYYNYLNQLTILLNKSNYKLKEKQNIINIYIDDMNEQLECFAVNHEDFLIALKNEKKEFEYFCVINLKIRKILIEMKMIEEEK